MLFKDIVSDEAIVQHLIDSHRAGRTAHAQLLLGGAGSGNLALALAYAQYLQCESPLEHDACGVCNACQKAQKLIHPDIHFTYPTIGTGKLSTDFIKEWRAFLQENPYPVLEDWLQYLGAENQQGNINKNECLDIVKIMSLKAVEGKFKIQIIWMPELLGKEGNRLLKLIEEPEENTVFILVAEQAEKIINTILSRCQLVKIPRFSDDKILSFLQREQGIPPSQATSIAYLSDGNLNKAWHMAKEQATRIDYAALWQKIMTLLMDGNGSEFVNWVEEIAGSKSSEKLGRKEQVMLLQYALFFFREIVAFKVHKNLELLRLDASQHSIVQRLEKVKFGVFQQFQILIDDSIFAIERNAAPKPLFLDFCIQAYNILRQ